MDKNVSRRGFVGASAALGSLLALGSCSNANVGDTPANDSFKESSKTSTTAQVSQDPREGCEVSNNWCQMCGAAQTNCCVTCYTKDGKLVYIEGNPDAGNNGGQETHSICLKGNAAVSMPYSPQRIQYPMKRVGEKGEGKFERITWEQAIKEIAAKFKENKEKYGPESLGILSPEFYPVLGTLGRRFLNVYGSPNYMHSGICALQRMAAGKISIGKAKTAPAQMDKTKLLVVWGANYGNSGMNKGNPAKHVKAQEKGMKVISIKPMLDPMAARSDIWMPIRPGTDAALGLAFLNVIIGEEFYDKEFVENWTVGFDELAEHVKPFTPAWASEITGLEESQINEVAHMLGTESPLGIIYGNGICDQANDGNWQAVIPCLISAITGNLDIPGGGGAGKKMPAPLVKLNPVDRLTDRLQASEEDKAKGYHAGMAKLNAPEFPRWYQNPKTWESGPNTAYYKGIMSILTEKPYPIKTLLGQKSNPMSSTRQPKKVAEALKKCDCYVAMDTTWNASCDYADYVLPAATGYETSHQIALKNRPNGTFIGMNNGTIEPMYESKSDWQFYLDLAVELGMGEDFWNGDMDECLREQLEGTGITLEELRSAPKGIFIKREDGAKPEEPTYKNYEKLFEDLPEGKVQCKNLRIGGKPNNTETGTLGYFPEYKGPQETLQDKELAEKYPLIITDVHAHRTCQHGHYHDVAYLRELAPYPWVIINPKAADKYGIKDDQWVRVESPHGYVKLRTKFYEGISPEVLMTKRGFAQPCDDLGLEGYPNYDGGSEINVLYDSEIENFDDFNSAMAKQTLVSITPWEEK